MSVEIRSPPKRLSRCSADEVHERGIFSRCHQGPLCSLFVHCFLSRAHPSYARMSHEVQGRRPAFLKSFHQNKCGSRLRLRLRLRTQKKEKHGNKKKRKTKGAKERTMREKGKQNKQKTNSKVGKIKNRSGVRREDREMRVKGGPGRWEEGGVTYHAVENQFERFRVFLELFSRFEFDCRRCEKMFLKDSNFCVNHMQRDCTCACAVASLQPTQFHFECCGVLDDSRCHIYIYIYLYILNVCIYIQEMWQKT